MGTILQKIAILEVIKYANMVATFLLITMIAYVIFFRAARALRYKQDNLILQWGHMKLYF